MIVAFIFSAIGWFAWDFRTRTTTYHRLGIGIVAGLQLGCNQLFGFREQLQCHDRLRENGRIVKIV
jgi:hypothetical protein